MKRLAGYLAALMIVALAPAQALAATDVLKGVNCQDPAVAHSAVCQEKNPKTNPLFGPDGIITKIAQVIAIIAGIVAVIMIIIGGFQYVLSGGDGNKTASAKNTILYALVGLIVVALAQVLVSFVLSKM